ncbi:hypothetical protein SCAR479_11884 [Seiridium cardinale]|uniref:Uncharacterized protein n=1 Tax=Seiridium cardinale TaxID=138064 RepID=A0ABR2XC49_9PEZI
MITPAISDCRSRIETFLEKVLEKYGGRLLRPTGSRRGLADVARMIQWHLCEADDVERIRENVRKAMDFVQLVQTRAQGQVIVQEQNDNIIAERLTFIEEAQSQAVEEVMARLKQLIEKLEADSRRKDED